MTALPLRLSRPETIDDIAELATLWREERALLRLQGAAGALEVEGFPNHVRRSFLGGLGRFASSEAQAGRPCDWDPPCALDVFGREQIRQGGYGLAKPYVLGAWDDGSDLWIELRVFGMASDWMFSACDGLVYGLYHILPWERLAGAKGISIIARRFAECSDLSAAGTDVRLEFVTPVHFEGSADERKLLRKLLPRVQAVAIWHGVALSDGGLASARAASDPCRFPRRGAVRTARPGSPGPTRCGALSVPSCRPCR